MYMNSTGGLISYSNGEAPTAGGDGTTPGDDSMRRPKPVYFWSKGEVMKWMNRHCTEYYDLYGNTFLEHDISGRSLIRVNDAALERMGIEDAKHRDEMTRTILKLKLKSDIIELKDLERKGAQNTTTTGKSGPSVTSSLGRSASGSSKPRHLTSFHR